MPSMAGDDVSRRLTSSTRADCDVDLVRAVDPERGRVDDHPSWCLRYVTNAQLRSYMSFAIVLCGSCCTPWFEPLIIALRAPFQ